MRKKPISILLTVVFIISLFGALPIAASATPAEVPYWTDGISAPDQYPFGGGDGTGAGEAFEISTELQLAQLAYNVKNGNNYNDKFFKLTADLDLAGYWWTPIGYDSTKMFQGTFDGNDHTVANLTIGSADNAQRVYYAGLFGYTYSAVIMDLSLTGLSLYLSDYDGGYLGGLIGNMYEGAAGTALVENCAVSGIMHIAEEGDYAYVGGLVGNLDEGTVTNCTTDVDIYGSLDDDIGGLAGESSGGIIDGCFALGYVSGGDYSGGLVGDHSSGTIQNSYSACTITSAEMAGGLVGFNAGTILNCYSTSMLTMTGSNDAGGLAAFNDNYGVVENCYSAGTVSAGSNNDDVGGLVGYCSGTLRNSYSVSTVINGSLLVDSLFEATISDCYWNSDSVTATALAGIAGTGKTTAELNDEAFLDTLNADVTGRTDDWAQWVFVAGENNGYPVLDGVGVGFTDDITAPVLSGGSAVRESQAAAEVTFASDEAGRYYYAVVADGAGAPSVNTTGAGAACTASGQSFDVSSLETSAAYDLYIVVKDDAGNVSTPLKTDVPAFPFDGGTGAEEDPYLIETASQLAAISDYCGSANSDKYFKQTANIDLGVYPWNDGNGWTPIGTFTNKFYGHFNGNGYVIENLSIVTSDGNQGLFYYVSDAVIENVHLENVDITGNYMLGSVAANQDGGVIQNCYVSGAVRGINNMGLLVGFSSGLIQGCCSEGTVTGDDSEGQYYVGGLVGRLANGAVLKDSFSTADVIGSNAVGGLLGYCFNSSVENCYSVGSVSGIDHYGGLVGWFQDSQGGHSVTSGYYDQTTSGMSDTGSGEPRTTAQMQQGFADSTIDSMAMYTGWDNAVWTFEPETDYPMLNWITPTDTTGPSASDYTINAGDLAYNKVTLNWTKATDEVSAQSALSYLVYQSDSNNIGTVAGIEANGTPIGSYEADISSLTVSGLEALSTYYFNIIVRDEAGNKTAYTVKKIETPAAPSGGGGMTPPAAEEDQISVYAADGSASVSGKLTHTEDDMSVVINGDDMNTLAETGADVVINTGSIVVTFDAEAAGFISGIAGTDGITINIEQVDTGALSPESRQLVGDRPVYDFSVTAGTTSVTEFDGGNAAVAIPYELGEGENPHAVVAYYIDSTGAALAVTGKFNAETGMVEFTTDHFSTYAIGYNPVSFTDVSDEDWYYEAVTFCAARGITLGTGGEQFEPESNLTRGQYLVMLMRAFSLRADGTYEDNFTDAGSTYYTPYLAAAKQLGIAIGTGNNQFAPDSNITRQDMFTLLYRTLLILEKLPETVPPVKTLDDFSDSDDLAPYAVDAMTALVAAGVVSGSDGLLQLNVLSSRAQMARVLFNLLS